jgi:hypothetical protein
MTTLLDARPAGLDVLVRPDDPKVLELTGWAAGELLGRTFVATLDGDALDVDVDLAGEVLTLSASAAQTAALAGPADFVLTEVLAGDDVDMLIGLWTPDTRPRAAEPVALAVDTGAIAVAVSVLAVPSASASNLIDEVVLEAPTADLPVNAFMGALVPGSIVTVPDVPYATLLRAHGSMIHSEAEAMCALVIVPEGGLITSRLDTGYGYNGTPATNPVTSYPEVLLDPHTPGTFQLMVFSFVGGTIRIEASEPQKTWLRVFSA